jgi:hypothetical protein
MSTKGSSLSPAKRAGGFLLILVVILVSILAGVAIARRLFGPPPQAGPAGGPSLAAFGVVAAVLGTLLLAFALAIYAATLATRCFTFDFRRPFYAAYKGKRYVLNIVVTLPLVLGAGFWMSAFLTPLLRALGLPFPVAFLAPILVTLVVLQLALVCVNPWARADRSSVRARLAAQGVPPAEVREAVLAGVSDPGRSSLRKLTFVEEDVGGLWIRPGALVYRGDADAFEASPAAVLALERRADSGSTAAYAGAVHPVLRLRLPDGSERSVRLHAWGCRTLSEVARSLEDLAARIEAWRSGEAARG